MNLKSPSVLLAVSTFAWGVSRMVTLFSMPGITRRYTARTGTALPFAIIAHTHLPRRVPVPSTSHLWVVPAF
ncbi:hypothetical protein J3R83DRAFT_9881 [Lanmaoa asiatica]|nr:hypothetical protein J3R83DRAFT_9881 [Lanmaoa asiatica]